MGTNTKGNAQTVAKTATATATHTTRSDKKVELYLSSQNSPICSAKTPPPEIGYCVNVVCVSHTRASSFLVVL